MFLTVPMKLKTLPAFLIFALATTLISSANTDDWEKKLSGIWSCDDRGTYYIRLVGRDVYWLGESADGGKSWTNIFFGKLVGRKIKGVWSDLPKGRAKGRGEMELKLSQDGLAFETVAGGENFGGKSWWKRDADLEFGLGEKRLPVLPDPNRPSAR